MRARPNKIRWHVQKQTRSWKTHALGTHYIHIYIYIYIYLSYLFYYIHLCIFSISYIIAPLTPIGRCQDCCICNMLPNIFNSLLMHLLKSTPDFCWYIPTTMLPHLLTRMINHPVYCSQPLTPTMDVGGLEP